MRYQGKISKWVDDKGFGFIIQDESGEQLFVHISGFEKGQQRPSVGEVVSYEVANDVKKGLQAYKIQYLNRPIPPVKFTKVKRHPDKKSNYGIWIFVGILLIGTYLYKEVYQPALQEIYETGREAEQRASQSLLLQAYKCAGKTHCSEMESCDEAKFYLNNCPGTIADGDGDGIPCEDQWCGH